MPKIIFTSRYIKHPAKVNAGKLIRYMGTREGVEKLLNGIDNKPPTQKQMDSKLKSKIEQKKQAHGLKTDRSVSEYSEDEQGFEMHM